MTLTNTKITQLPIGKKTCDGRGLYLQLTGPKRGKWSFRYTIGRRTFYYKPEVETWLEKKREERGFQKIFSDLKQILNEDFLIHNLKFEKEEKP